jgi:hypothetical protein
MRDRPLSRQDYSIRSGNAMMLSELAEAMFRFSPGSDAWKDFATDCRERLNIASLTAVAGVDTPADFSEYWLTVAWGESEDYDTDGARAVIH